MADETSGSKWVVLAVAGSGVYMSTLDAGMVNVALPTITAYFGAPIVVTQWVVLAYLLCITGLLLPMGRLADMYGRKRVFLTGFVAFAVGSAACGFAPSLGALIAARVVQGVGGAMLQANSLGLVAQAFPSAQRGRALGMNLSIVSAGFLSGPVLGGLIIDWLGWPWIFFVSVPIAILAVLFGLRRLAESEIQPGQRFDPAGAALFMALVVGLLLALNFGGQVGWASPLALGLAAATALAAVLFMLVERRVAQPIIEIDLFRSQGVRAAITSGFLMFLAISHAQLLMPFYLQLGLGLTAAQVGLVLVTQPAMLFVLAPIAGALSDRLGSRWLASAGAAIASAGLLSLATLDLTSTPLAVAARLAVMALGIALFNSPNASALFGALPREKYGVGGAYQSLTRNLGQSLGQVIAATLWTAVVLETGGVATTTAAPPAALMAGFRAVWVLAAVIVAGAAVVSLVARPRTPTPVPTPASEPAGRPR